jgi:hypothetical protein
MERSSIALTETLKLGDTIIKGAGGIEAYDLNARRRKELAPAEEITREIMRLTDDAARKQAVVFEE